MTDLIKRDDALLPCPFCGGKKNTICRTDYDGLDAYAVSCRYSECHGAIFMLGYGFFATKAEAIAAWNTRALPAVTVGEDVAKAAIDRAIARLQALHNYAGRPAWDAIVAEEIRAALEPVAAPDPAAIREDALREATALCDRYPYVEGVKAAILALIGETK